MKTVKPPQTGPDAGPASATTTSRRAQPIRQTRTNPPRSAVPGRTLRDPAAAGPSVGQIGPHDQPINIFPAVAHFTDAITSLPKDLVRHFTLLKEVDAKIFAPEAALFELADACLKTAPTTSSSPDRIALASAPMNARGSSNGGAVNSLSNASGIYPEASSTDRDHRAAMSQPTSIHQKLVVETTTKLSEMIGSLEEKSHVITTANDALSKQLARIDDIWPHLEKEFSDEAKWGSTTHWAYPDNRAQKASAAERSRRDGASAITAAAQQLAEEAAARTEARRQALAAKKGVKTQRLGSDLDADADHNNQNNKSKGEGSKKAKRKTAETNASVGLGIAAGPSVNGANPPPKRRRVDQKEKTAHAGQAMERSLSTAMASNASKIKMSSPQATPALEAGSASVATRKRKALPTANGQAKKSKTCLPPPFATTMASSPVLPHLPEPKLVGASPLPAFGAVRPASSRARQNSAASNMDNPRPRPVSSASNRTNGIPPSTPESSMPQGGLCLIPESKSAKEAILPIKGEGPKESMPQSASGSGNSAVARSRKNSVAKTNDHEKKPESAPLLLSATATVVTTKSGRASKPSTPALGSFPEPGRVRTRNTQTDKKRSHKKGAGQAAVAAAQTQAVDGDMSGKGQPDEGAGAGGGGGGGGEAEADADEPRYCYCNRVSYGEMVACDAADCEKEWFHLDCVGLKSAPSPTTKWYCDNCKIRMKSGKKVNGR